MAAYTWTSVKSFKIQMLVVRHYVWQMGLKDVNVYASNVDVYIRMYMFVSLHMPIASFGHFLTVRCL